MLYRDLKPYTKYKDNKYGEITVFNIDHKNQIVYFVDSQGRYGEVTYGYVEMFWEAL